MGRDRGASVLMMVTLMLAISLTFTLAGYSLISGLGNQTTGKGDYDKTAEMAKGLGDFSERIISEYYRHTLEPSPTDVEKILKAQLPALLASLGGNKYRLVNVKFSAVEARSPSIVGFSAFRGMVGPQNILDLTLTLSRPSGILDGEEMVSELKLTLAIASIHLFKFAIFSTSDETFNGAAYFTAQGRVHANGNICVGGKSSWQYAHFFDHVTAAGNFLLGTDPACGALSGRTAHAFISITDDFSPPDSTVPIAMIKASQFKEVPITGAHGCTDCDGTGLNWAEYARRYFKDHVLDSAHGVDPLILPGTSVTPVQRGMGALITDSSVSNQGHLRMLVDPVRQEDDPVIVKSKISYKSDLRIINGVWYLRDPAQPEKWPGLPIWSDHPGHFVERGVPVGQEDIRNRLNGSDQAWSAGLTPQKFSYYEFKPGVGVSDTDQMGIISYGSLSRVAGRPITDPEPWELSHWVDSKASGDALCTSAGGLKTCGSGGCGFMSVFNQLDSAKKLKCQATAPTQDPSLGAMYLNAARSGYLDPILRYFSKDAQRVENGCAPPSNDDESYERSKLLPTNFNVNQFQQALQDTTPGELGSFFTNGRKFNGIIYISLTWPHSEEGYNGIDFATGHPFQGNVKDVSQIPATSMNAQQALPYNLCSQDLGGQDFDSSKIFKIPHCSQYDPSNPKPILAFSNVIRIFNGRTLDPKIFDQGLTIASNMPTYLMGDYNSSEYEKDPIAFKNQKDDWVAALLASDYVTSISSGWNDLSARWSFREEMPYRFCDAASAVANPLYVGEAVRNAVETTQVLSILSGNSSGIPTVETGTGTGLTRIGSVVEGFHPVYHISDDPGTFQTHSARVYSFGDRNKAYDPHLDFRQPPGAPAFSVVGSLKITVE